MLDHSSESWSFPVHVVSEGSVIAVEPEDISSRLLSRVPHFNISSMSRRMRPHLAANAFYILALGPHQFVVELEVGQLKVCNGL